MATKFLKIKKIKSKGWSDLLFFNYNVEELNSCDMIERLKIYKDGTSKFNFSPNEEKIKVILSQLFSKIKYKSPTTETEFKIAQKVIQGADEIKKDAIKRYFKSGSTAPHYGTTHPLEDEKSDNTQKIIGTNLTSQKTTFGLKNEPIAKNSFLTQPFIAKEKVVEWDEEKRLPKNTFDLRNIANQLKIQELLLVSSLGFDKNKCGYFITKENKPTLKEHQQTSLQKTIKQLNINPGAFKIYKIGADLKKLYEKILENELIEKNIVFNYALSLLFNDAAVVDMIYALAKQTTKS